MNKAVELQILASLMRYPEKIEEFHYHIKPHHFNKQIATVYSKIIELKDNNLPINLNILQKYIDGEIALELSQAMPIPDFFNYIILF